MIRSPDFIAGLITGEGSFGLGVMRLKNDRIRVVPFFAIFMTDEEMIGDVAESLQAMDLPIHIQKRNFASWKRSQLGIHVGGYKRLKRYCEVLTPLLGGKKKQAALLVQEFILSREAQGVRQGGGRKNWPLTEEQKELVRRIRAVNGNTNGKKNPI